MEEESENILIEEEKTIYEIDGECLKKHRLTEEVPDNTMKIRK